MHLTSPMLQGSDLIFKENLYLSKKLFDGDLLTFPER